MAKSTIQPPKTSHLLTAVLVALLALVSGFIIGKAAATSLYNHTATGGVS